MTKRILVTAACTSDALADSLRLLFPGAEVSWNHVLRFLTDEPDPALEAQVQEADHWIYLQRPETTAIARRVGNGIAIPEVAFNAFHPDEVDAHSQDGVVITPMDSLHSAIGVWAYAKGCTAREAAHLFQPKIFEQLGYLDCWNTSVAQLEKACDDTDIDYRRLLERIKRQMPFMTTTRHPRLILTTEIARQIARKIGHPNPAEDPIEDYLFDPLRALIWPIYPAIADRYGVRGAMRWKNHNLIYDDAESYLDACYAGYPGRDQVFSDRLINVAYDSVLERYV